MGERYAGQGGGATMLAKTTAILEAATHQLSDEFGDDEAWVGEARTKIDEALELIAAHTDSPGGRPT